MKLRALTLVMLFALFFVNCRVAAQENPGMESGLPPFGAYGGSDFDHVNLQNGSLHIDVPVYSVTERGETFNWVFTYDAPIWSASWILNPTPRNPYAGVYGINSPGASGWTLSAPGNWTYYPQSITSPACSGTSGVQKLFSNYVVVDPVGTLHAFPLQVYETNCTGGSIPLTGIAPAMDGSGIVLDVTHSQIILKNGTKIIASGSNSIGGSQPPFTIEDTNGNTTTQDVNGNFYDYFGRETVTTTQGPSVSFTTPLGAKTQPYPQYTLYQFYAPNGTTQTFRVDYQAIDVESDVGTMVNTPNISVGPWVVPQKLTLPNGQAHTIVYNNNTAGQVASITTPTGATISFAYGRNYFVQPITVPRVPATVSGRDGVSTRTVTGSGFNYEWTYQYSSNTSTTVNGPTDTEIHTFSQPTSTSGSTYYLSPNYVESGVQYFAPGTTTNPLKTVQTTFVCDPYIYNTQCVNDRPTIVTTTLDNGMQTQVQTDYETFAVVPTNSNLATATRLNPTEIREYSYGPTSPGALARKTDYTYLHNNPSNGATYVGLNIVDRILMTTVYSASGGMASQATKEYDNYTSGITASGVIEHASTFSTSYLTRGNVTATERWLNTDGATLTTRRQYDDAGNVLSVTDPLSHITTYGYSDNWSSQTGGSACEPSSGQSKAYQTKVTDPLGHVTQRFIMSCGGLLGITIDPNNGQTSTTFDEMERPLVSTLADGGQTMRTYNDTSLVITTAILKQSGQYVYANEYYDQLGRHTEHQLCEDGTSSCSSPISIQYTLDAGNRVIARTNPCRPTADSTCGVTQYQYDALDRQTLTIPPDGSSSADNIKTQYCNNSTLVTDEAGKWHRTIHDALNRTVETDQPNSATATVSACPNGSDPIIASTYTYDALNNLVGISQNGSRLRSWVFDSLSEMTSSVSPETGATTYTHDNGGNLASRTDARSIKTTFSYDAGNRLLSETYSDGTPPANYGYDSDPYISGAGTNAVGRVAYYTNSSTVGYHFSYDLVGRPVKVWECVPGNPPPSSSPCPLMSYSYNLVGDMTSLTNPDGITLSQTFDSVGRLTSISSSLVDAQHPSMIASTDAAVGFYPAGQVRKMTLGNGLTETGAYNSRLQPCRLNVNSTSAYYTACNSALPSGNVLDITYGFGFGSNDNGDVLSWSATGQQTFNRTYTYDALNRILTMTAPGDTCSGLSWTYDAWGNRTAQSATGGTCTGFQDSVNSNNQFMGSPYQYDQAGDMTHDASHQYYYDAENRIVQVDGTLGTCSTATACYVYDPATGERAEKIVGTSTTTYIRDLDGRVAAEWAPCGGSTSCWTEFYLYFGDALVAEYQNGTTYFVHRDHLSSTRLLTALNGAVYDSIDYLPFGELVGGGFSTTHKFTSKERDTESNLEYFEARYNSSTLGRFMVPDSGPLDVENPETFNRYTYALNNPIAYTDPDGRDPQSSTTVDLGSYIQPVWDELGKNDESSPGHGRIGGGANGEAGHKADATALITWNLYYQYEGSVDMDISVTFTGDGADMSAKINTLTPLKPQPSKIDALPGTVRTFLPGEEPNEPMNIQIKIPSLQGLGDDQLTALETAARALMGPIRQALLDAITEERRRRQEEKEKKKKEEEKNKAGCSKGDTHMGCPTPASLSGEAEEGSL
jgi:RHS repeat-associated protein